MLSGSLLENQCSLERHVNDYQDDVNAYDLEECEYANEKAEEDAKIAHSKHV